MTKNLLIITQKVDENDDLLGFFVRWIKEFSKRFDKIFVIALAKGEYELPENVFVYSLGKEKGSSRFVRFIKFYWYLFKLAPKANGIFAHMSPIFVIMSWPIVVIFRKRIVLWYLHRSVTLRLKIAEKLCYKIVTAAKESLNLKSKKVVEAGHGIDVEKFKNERNWKDLALRPIEILSVGRISKIKNYETLVKTACILKDRGFDFKLKIVGRPVMLYDFEYFENLKQLVQRFKLTGSVEFVGFVPYSRIADYYKESDIFINLAPTGGIDKAVLEAMAAGCLVAVANEAFRKYFNGSAGQLLFKYGDEESLARLLVDFYNIDSSAKENISEFLIGKAGENSVANVISRISYLV